MGYAEEAKELLNGNTCQKCIELNPYEWPMVWCRHLRDKPESNICAEFVIRPGATNIRNFFDHK